MADLINRGGQNVALEGPCCAGKTTLGHGLLDDMSGLSVKYVTDYSDYVGGGRFLPTPIPASLAEEERTLDAFLLIEADRTRHVRSSSSELILIDRSVHTLLAHCRALELMTGVPYSALAQRVITRSETPLWPDLIFYLDISTDSINDRDKGKFASDSIFINAEFNDGIRLYFKELADTGTPTVAWLDAMLDPVKLRDLAKVHLRGLLPGEHI